MEILAADADHPDAQTIFAKARKSLPSLSLSTVYYTLNELKQRGLIREIEFYAMTNRYDVNMADHVNLVCRRCHAIKDYPEELLIAREVVKKKTGFSVDNMRLEYYGLCKECRRKQ